MPMTFVAPKDVSVNIGKLQSRLPSVCSGWSGGGSDTSRRLASDPSRHSVQLISLTPFLCVLYEF